MRWKLIIRKIFWSLGIDLVKYDPDNSLASYIRMLVRELDIDCILDVGAHRGEFATGLRTFGYTGRIISFEPVTRNFLHLQQIAARDSHWEVHQLALGSEERDAEINITASTVLCSFLDPVTEQVDATETVQVRRLDQLLPELIGEHSRAFLKMDTQGYDLEVVRGASAVLQRIPAILTEMSVQPLYRGSPPFTAALSELEQQGFHPSAMFPVYRDAHKLVEFDCVLVR